jgi:diguanylate cyclase (GGDEF)-like protein
MWIGVAVARSATGVLPAELMVVNGLLFLFAALGMHLLVFEEMTFELRTANRRLQETQTKLHGLAITDSLTGCYNRRFFHEVIGRELQRHERYDLPLALLFVDIDQFKMVNDTLGHEAGDRLLEYVALFLKGNVREADYVFRWGGDEFLVLLSCTLEEALEKGAELTTTFRAAVKTASGIPTGVGLSVGCSEVIAHTDDIMDRIREADEAMYRKKQDTKIGTGD